MPGNRVGGKRAAATNKKRYGDSFYASIGRIGGSRGHSGGFASNPELARKAGQKGGRTSKRGEGSTRVSKIEPNREEILSLFLDAGLSIPQIATRMNIPYSTLLSWFKTEVPEYENQDIEFVERRLESLDG